MALRHLRQVRPASSVFGYDRPGSRIGRYYIERFLADNAGDVRGHALEIADDRYTVMFGGARVERSDILHAVPGNPRATIVADLCVADHIPSETFDCIVCTQTLQFIYDAPAAIRTLYRILKPGGVVLATVSGISQMSRYDMERWGDFWRFTPLSARRLFQEAFAAEDVCVTAYGNIFAAVAFLHGLAVEELRPNELDYVDDDYPVIIAVRAQKPCASI